MTIFGIEHAGFYLAAYLLFTYVSTMVFMFVVADEGNVSHAGLLVFVIGCPFFVARGFLRALVKGWRELNPKSYDSRGIRVFPEPPNTLGGWALWLVITCLIGVAGFSIIEIFKWALG